jgi:hypothetical protein
VNRSRRSFECLLALCATFCLALASSCASPAPTRAPAQPAAPPTPAPTPTPAGPPHGIDPADMDPAVGACDRFYEYADGGWLKKNPVPPEYSSWGSFNEVDERNREFLRQILEKAAADRGVLR